MRNTKFKGNFDINKEFVQIIKQAYPDIAFYWKIFY